MAFLESRLDARITRGVTFTETVPGRTLRRYASGGLDQEFIASAPILRCDLSHGVRSADDYQSILDAWMVVMFTPYEGLRVKNWRDYQATSTNSAVASLGAGEYQLQRKHTFGAVSYYRDIKKPVSGTVAVFDAGGTPLTATVDYTDGTFTVLSGTPSYWTGQFDFPMTFSDNEWQATLEVSTQNLHVVSGSISMEEVR